MSYLKRLTNAALGRLQAFRMYGGIGMSASSLHRESTDSLIYMYIRMYVSRLGMRATRQRMHHVCRCNA